VQTVIANSTAQALTVSATAVATTGAVVALPTAAGPGATSVPTSQAAPTPVQASVAPELAAAIIKGYDNYWSVRVRAMGDPTDKSIDLESVMAGDELSTASNTLSDYRDAGEAFQTTVEHQVWITRATPDEAAVVDRFSGKSVKIDLATKAPVSAGDIVEHFTSTFRLRNFNGTWKVVGQSQER
jgi:hypothetical protein